MELVFSRLYPPPDQCFAPLADAATCDSPETAVEVEEGPVRGHYCADGRRYYVDSARRVTLICGPDGPCFTRVGELPADAKVDRQAVADSVLWALAMVAEAELGVQP
ncbi:hypothetical protein OV203_46660 [Nannocystis sp. ILAH1]|uniref:hypothetical protein n=1 Tax=Nannocystis sp. ILAH1 TaxID=2996789 RepID=UPI00226F6342|nr:hypothetical protein [Nannocystis sp. ILAH1]MCY0994697.1 hypothetical protein [Nannocystis sp. ILAH1]